MKLKQEYGSWTVVQLPDHKRRTLCRCVCGVEKHVFASNLTAGKSTSCGCSTRVQLPKQGDKIHDWTILSPPRNIARVAHVRCSCGQEQTVSLYSIARGDSTSCGHGRLTGPRARLFNMWEWMWSRCTNIKDPMYRYYGARGIRVADVWKDSDTYIKWALSSGWKKSSGLQIDRIDNDGPYSPDNCRIATLSENANNKSNNRIVFAFGVHRTLAEWTTDPRCSVSYPTLYARISYLSWDPETAIVTPVWGKKRFL
jgi:hypothetical protein